MLNLFGWSNRGMTAPPDLLKRAAVQGEGPCKTQRNKRFDKPDQAKPAGLCIGTNLVKEENLRPITENGPGKTTSQGRIWLVRTIERTCRREMVPLPLNSQDQDNDRLGRGDITE